MSLVWVLFLRIALAEAAVVVGETAVGPPEDEGPLTTKAWAVFEWTISRIHRHLPMILMTAVLAEVQSQIRLQHAQHNLL